MFVESIYHNSCSGFQSITETSSKGAYSFVLFDLWSWNRAPEMLTAGCSSERVMVFTPHVHPHAGYAIVCTPCITQHQPRATTTRQRMTTHNHTQDRTRTMPWNFELLGRVVNLHNLPKPLKRFIIFQIFLQQGIFQHSCQAKVSDQSFF